MQKADVLSDWLCQGLQERNDVMLHHLLDRRNALRVDPRFPSNTSCHATRDFAGPFQRLAGEQLDLKPNLVLSPEIPHGLHSGQGVSVYHLILRVRARGERLMALGLTA